MFNLSIDFTEKLILQVLASLATLLIGILLFMLNTLKERRVKRNEKRLKDLDLLRYLSLVAKRLIDLTSKELNTFKEAGNKLTENPFNAITLSFNYRIDFQRGTSFRTTDYLSAYRTEIGHESHQIEQFLNLTSNMEYAAKVYDDLSKSYDEKASIIEKYREEYLEIFNSVVHEIDEMSCHPDYQENKELVEYLRNLSEGFFAIMGNGNDIYTKAYESAFSPIINSFYIDPELRFGKTGFILKKVEIAQHNLRLLEYSSIELGRLLIKYAIELQSIQKAIESSHSDIQDKVV